MGLIGKNDYVKADIERIKDNIQKLNNQIRRIREVRKKWATRLKEKKIEVYGNGTKNKGMAKKA